MAHSHHSGHGHHAAHGHASHSHQGHHGHQGHGHQGHAIVVVPGRKAKGGPVMEKEPGKKMEDERTREMVSEEEEGRKRGGKVKGAHARPRADKRARGGRMTPKEPFSGADGPNPPYARSREPSPGTEGKGREVRP